MSKELLGGQDAVAELPDPFGVIAHVPDSSGGPTDLPSRDERHVLDVLGTTDAIARGR